MGFLGNLKERAIDKIFIRDEEYAKEEKNENGEVGYGSETEQQPESEKENSTAGYNDYSYSPTGGLDSFETNNTFGSTPEFKFTKPSSSAFSSTPVVDFNSSGDKKITNIYSMNSIRPADKFKLNSISLKDIYGAKDVAHLLMEKDTIVLVDFSMLTAEQKIRAMDFIDGAKCVTKSVFGRINEDFVVFVPENVELYGDFQSQIDFDSIR